MSSTCNLTFARPEKVQPVSPVLYGIFFEDINFSCDGGINANMVNNYSFDGIYYSSQEQRAVEDPLRYWSIEGGTLKSGTDGALHKNSRYGSLLVNGHTVLSNLGYNGGKAHSQECAMSICAEHSYLFECWMRSGDFQGTVSIQVSNDMGLPLTTTGTLAASESGGKDSSPEEAPGWRKVSCTVHGMGTGYGKLEIVADGKGRLDLDCISLMDEDYWHKGDPKWRYGRLRKDLIQALADLKPAFMRFPGGCIVEGQLPGNEYHWKDTIGELYQRKTNYNLWSEKLADGGYSQSYQIGFYEYFCLCEDLGMKPLPTLTVGLNCQIRSAQRRETECPNIPLDSEAFQTEIIDNYLDLIEFANGDPETSKWAAIRAEMGHPEPFGLDRIGVGNENYGETYFQRFAAIEAAIHEKYPEMICIFCGGVHPYYQDLMGITGITRAYREAAKHPNVLVDEHSYHTPEWFARQSTRFDTYDRSGPGVYFGEYAANGMLTASEDENGHLPEGALQSGQQDEQGGMRPMNQSNMLDTALGEAAFLTGIERNSDIVAMTSYAPLFNLVESDQWNHNLINFNPQALCLSTNYYVQQMFSTHLGTRYLPCEGTLPENVYVSATEDADAIYVKVVNTGDAPVRLALNLPAASTAASVTRLHSGDPQVRNDLTFTQKPVYVIEPESYTLPIDNCCLEMCAVEYSVQVLVIEK